VWFNEDAIANIILMSEAERKGHIISYTVGCLKLQNPSSRKVTSFHLTPGGLYAFRVPSNSMSLVQTVAENGKFFTPRQIAQAKVARDLYAMIGRPSKNDFMGIINNNLLLNSPITAQDITNAETIFGKDIGSIQGKTTRTRPQRVITDFVKVPNGILKYHREITLSIDVMMIDKIMFLVTASHNIQFTTVTYLETKGRDLLEKSILMVIRLYARRGFTVARCLSDLEFVVTKEALLTSWVLLNTCGPGDHVPVIEQRIRTIKERVRGLLISLPFEKIPDLVMIHSVVFSVMWLNSFCPKGGVSAHISSQTIITGLTPNAVKHCRIPFGGYAQVHVEFTPLNDVMVSRTVGAIALGPT
jgi:hypothetical protein